MHYGQVYLADNALFRKFECVGIVWLLLGKASVSVSNTAFYTDKHAWVVLNQNPCSLSLYLLSGDDHVIPHIRENRGLNEKPLQAQSFASMLQLGSFTDAALDVLQHPILLVPTDLWRWVRWGQDMKNQGRRDRDKRKDKVRHFGSERKCQKQKVVKTKLLLKHQNSSVVVSDSHLWTLLGSGIKGAADYPPLGSLHTPPNKLIIHGFLHKDARACRATLACVEKHSLVGLFHSQIHWGGGFC